MPMDKKKKDVLIRGVDEEAYREVATLAKELNVSVGSIVSEALMLFSSLVEEQDAMLFVPLKIARITRKYMPSPIRKIVPYIVRHLGRLRISGKDLANLDSPVIFLSIDELIFEDDVDEKIFDEKVFKIVNCGTVEIPSHLRKFVVLRKTFYVREIKVR
ncbi:MAG: hypothetical protein DRZ80_01950 [Thermoprotei archaeon]|nr:MAG: hypothetical protein DRZ80_01950 [Thermoprotei archaeon]